MKYAILFLLIFLSACSKDNPAASVILSSQIYTATTPAANRSGDSVYYYIDVAVVNRFFDMTPLFYGIDTVKSKPDSVVYGFSSTWTRSAESYTIDSVAVRYVYKASSINQKIGLNSNVVSDASDIGYLHLNPLEGYVTPAGCTLHLCVFRGNTRLFEGWEHSAINGSQVITYAGTNQGVLTRMPNNLQL